jgi:hypothetical protein
MAGRFAQPSRVLKRCVAVGKEKVLSKIKFLFLVQDK